MTGLRHAPGAPAAIDRPGAPAVESENAPRRRRVAVCVAPEMSLSSVAIACEPMRSANRCFHSEVYEIVFVGPAGGCVVSGIGIAVEPALRFDSGDTFDMVIAVSSFDQPETYKRPLRHFLRRHAHRGAEICGVDFGVVFLAEAGLLDGHRASVHWEVMDAVVDRFPDVDVCDDIYVIDGNRLSCGGHMACNDLFLEVVERHHGEATADFVAADILSGSRRSADIRQTNPLSWDPTIRNAHLRRATDIMQEHLEEPLPIPQIAREIGISLRQLQNLSRQHFGETVSERYLVIRLNAARHMLMYSDMSITEIVVATGFSSSATFARAFRHRFRTTATQYRRDFKRSQARPLFIADD